MTKEEARTIIMEATQKAMQEYREINKPNWKALYKNDAQLTEYLNKQTEYINSILAKTIPYDVGELAI